MARLSGKCMCGEVTFSATPEGEAGACHCGMCRKWSGGMFLSVQCSDIEFDADESAAIYQGSPWAERVFCSKCGSSLMWRTQDHQYHHVSIQAFDDPGQFKIGTQVFIDRKPDNYALTNETKNMTEAEIFAMFAPQGEA